MSGVSKLWDGNYEFARNLEFTRVLGQRLCVRKTPGQYHSTAQGSALWLHALELLKKQMSEGVEARAARHDKGLNRCLDTLRVLWSGTVAIPEDHVGRAAFGTRTFGYHSQVSLYHTLSVEDAVSILQLIPDDPAEEYIAVIRDFGIAELQRVKAERLATLAAEEAAALVGVAVADIEAAPDEVSLSTHDNQTITYSSGGAAISTGMFIRTSGTSTLGPWTGGVTTVNPAVSLSESAAQVQESIDGLRVIIDAAGPMEGVATAMRGLGGAAQAWPFAVSTAVDWNPADGQVVVPVPIPPAPPAGQAPMASMSGGEGALAVIAHLVAEGTATEAQTAEFLETALAEEPSTLQEQTHDN